MAGETAEQALPDVLLTSFYSTIRWAAAVGERLKIAIHEYALLDSKSDV